MGKFTEHAAFPAVVIFVFLIIGIALGFFVCWMTAPNRVFVDKEIDSLVGQVMTLSPEDWSIYYHGWSDNKTFTFSVKVDDQEFEFSGRKTISDLYKDLETIKRALSK
jgi:hypothetical protein